MAKHGLRLEGRKAVLAKWLRDTALLMGVLLFWCAFDQVAGMFASVCFLLLGLQTLAGDVSHLPTALQVYVNVIQTLVFIFCLGFFLVTFPNGRFVPRWSWQIGCTLFVQAILFMLPGPYRSF